MKWNLTYQNKNIKNSFLHPQIWKNNEWSSEIIVRLPSAVGNWNSEVRVKNGTTVEFNVCVEDWKYLADLQLSYPGVLTIEDEDGDTVELYTITNGVVTYVNPFGDDTVVIGYMQDAEVIRAAAADSTKIEATAPRYGSMVLYDDNTYKVYRTDDTWGEFE